MEPPAPAGHTKRFPVRTDAADENLLLPVPPRTLTALPGLREKVTGRADPYPTCSRCRRTPPSRCPLTPATGTTTKTTLTSNDATTPTTFTLNGG